MLVGTGGSVGTVLLSLCTALVAVCTFIGLFKLWQIRTSQSIVRRRPALLITQCLAFLVYLIFKVVLELTAGDISVGDKQLLTVILLEVHIVACYTFIVRAMLLVYDLYRNDVANKFFEISKNDSLLKSNEGTFWVLRNRKWFKEAVQRKVIAAGLLILMLVAFPIIAFANSLNQSILEGAILFVVSISVVGIVVFTIAREKMEAFGIKSELFQTCVALVFTEIFMIINSTEVSFNLKNSIDQPMGNFPFYFYLYVFIPTTFVIFIVPFQAWKFSQQFPVRHHQLDQDISQSHSQSQSVSQLSGITNPTPRLFESVLRNPKGFQLFKQHVIKELSVENLLFWKDVENLKAGFVTAQQVYETYIQTDAPIQITLAHNIKSKIDQLFVSRFDESISRDATVSELQRPLTIGENKFTQIKEDYGSLASEPSPSVASLVGVLTGDIERDRTIALEKAQQKIFSLMMKDSFTRFRKTPEFRSLCEDQIL
jgi:hypothetical protein